ncbi:MAG: aminotransferase class I/II-fold pyridoxal phosphate-dependent enzyme [Candidatus Zixiibacteriota bacterium]|nr:MAG: aminotransferase class I/II-fold pyridoxal phosphate-dependent enzyme [candidate division Zixibacteria bacterium]
MQKRYVRIANALLDLEPFDSERSEFYDGGIDPSALRLNNNESMMAPSPGVLSAIKNLLERESLNRFPDPRAVRLKNKIAEYCGMPAEYIGCYPGAGISLENILKTFLEPGTEMLTAGAVPADKLIAARTAGSTVVETDYDNPFSPSLEPVINNIGKRTRVLYLGNPSEYIGSFFTEAELVFLLAYAENTMIVVDESYFEFSGFTAADLVRKFPNLTIIRSLSHAFGLAAMNVSYVITDPENLVYMNRLSAGYAIDAVSQVAAEAALDDPDYMRRYVSTVNRSKDLISANLPETGYDFYISPANFFVLRVSDPESAYDYLKNNGVLVKDLSGINRLEGLIRITVGIPEQTDRLLLLLGRAAERFATGFNRSRIARLSNVEEKNSVKSGLK